MKHKIPKKIFLSILPVGLIILLFTSCEKKAIQFGEQFVDNDYTKVSETDTLTPFISTVFIDSFVTSNSGSGIIGHTVDSAFGTLTSSANFQMGVPSYNAASTEYTDATFDSLTIYAKINKGIWYGDTTKPIKVNVYRLNKIISPPNGGTSLYNTSTVDASSTPLNQNSFEFKLRPNAIDSTNDTLSIRISDDLGKELLQKLKTNDFNIQNADQFLSYFAGIKIGSDATSNMSFSISDSVQMRLYYRKPDNPIPVEKYVSFPMNNSAKQFNNISLDRTGLLAQQNFGRANRNIASSKTGNTAFLNPMGNAMIKIMFPSLNSVLKQYFIKITKATLQIYTTPNSYNGAFNLPPTLNLVQTDLNNGIGSPLVSLDGTSSAQTGSLSYSSVLPYYTYDLTAALTQYLADPTTAVNEKGLLLIPSSSSMFKTFNRLIIGDANNQQAKMKLIIDYISIK